MALNIFNTLSRSKEEFEPISENKVGLYTCGPTVYNYPHIGNYRAYIFGDILKRYLTYRGYNVKHIMNITDIDDKTIRDSKAQGKSLKYFTEFYTLEFYKDRDELNITKADNYTKATDFIPEMVKIIEKLLEKGFAYKTEDGSVYFDIHKDPDYGKLSHFKISDLKENAKGRITKDEYDKDSAEDFALWKAWDNSDGEVFWETSLGKGRPGWHIECSAMSMHELGETFDLHTGGVDNMFPHHENEIAQSECATGKMFSKYFMHNEHLMVDGVKMAKSAGNFYTLRDLIEKGVEPLAFRLWIYGAHYRTKTNFTLDAVNASQVALKRLHEFFRNLIKINTGSVDQNYKERFMEYMDDDLDTPKALALLWDLVHNPDIRPEDKKATMLDFDKVFGFGLENLKEEEIPKDINLDNYIKAKEEKNWEEVDRIRKNTAELGYKIEDTVNGPKVKKL